MYIKSITLKNWKGYDFAEFTFPEPEGIRNVVLIGAKNGSGKTSLLEALIMGLFGREGLQMVPRARSQNTANGRPDISYNHFLERALHARARGSGRPSCAVRIDFVDDKDRPLSIERKWHFTMHGVHRPDQEELLIREGEELSPISVPGDEERAEYLRGYLTLRLLPSSLLKFHFIDGEQVQELARKEQSSQVRLGLESILGVSTLRELQDDLRLYSRKKRSEIPSIDSAGISEIQSAIEHLEEARTQASMRLAVLQARQKELLEEREAVLRKLASIQSGNVASRRELYEQRRLMEQVRDNARETVTKQLFGDIPLLLVGKSLRDQLLERLKTEEEYAAWAEGHIQGEQNRTRFLERFESFYRKTTPKLTPEQERFLRQSVLEAWEATWTKPPSHCISEFLHRYLGRRERVDLENRLTQLSEVSTSTLAELLKKEVEAKQRIDECDYHIASLTSHEEDLNGLAAQLTRCIDEEKAIASAIDRTRGELQALDSQLTSQTEKLANLLEDQRRAQPNLRRAVQADLVINVLDKVIQQALPVHCARVAMDMTSAYKAMAHKGVVEKIEIDADCNVRTLSRDGTNLQSMDASAGEEQIFALSLIAAVAETSANDFPVVMDTPLARLDSEHRMGVLNYFTKRSAEQVIFLSQSDEINGPYLEAIRHRIASTYLIEAQDVGGGVCVNRVMAYSYFQEM